MAAILRRPHCVNIVPLAAMESPYDEKVKTYFTRYECTYNVAPLESIFLQND